MRMAELGLSGGSISFQYSITPALQYSILHSFHYSFLIIPLAPFLLLKTAMEGGRVRQDGNTRRGKLENRVYLGLQHPPPSRVLSDPLRICVDTTILIDVLKDDFRPIQEKLYQAIARNEQLVSPAVVFGELMPQFKGDEKQVADFMNLRTVLCPLIFAEALICEACPPVLWRVLRLWFLLSSVICRLSSAFFPSFHHSFLIIPLAPFLLLKTAIEDG
jgi:hypothetical protein